VILTNDGDTVERIYNNDFIPKKKDENATAVYIAYNNIMTYTSFVRGLYYGAANFRIEKPRSLEDVFSRNLSN